MARQESNKRPCDFTRPDQRARTPRGRGPTSTNTRPPTSLKTGTPGAPGQPQTPQRRQDQHDVSFAIGSFRDHQRKGWCLLLLVAMDGKQVTSVQSQFDHQPDHPVTMQGGPSVRVYLATERTCSDAFLRHAFSVSECTDRTPAHRFKHECLFDTSRRDK